MTVELCFAANFCATVVLETPSLTGRRRGLCNTDAVATVLTNVFKLLVLVFAFNFKLKRPISVIGCCGYKLVSRVSNAIAVFSWEVWGITVGDTRPKIAQKLAVRLAVPRELGKQPRNKDLYATSKHGRGSSGRRRLAVADAFVAYQVVAH